MSESPPPLRMVIFGGTGQTGTELVEQALAQGHSVRVLARNPEKAKALPEQVEIQLGDATDAAAVAAAIEGQDAVLCAVGGQGLSDAVTRSQVTELILAEMQRQSVHRLVLCSVVGIGESAAHLGWFSRQITGIFLKHAMADHRQQEALVRASELDWVIIRPPQLVNGPLTEGYRIATEAESFRASRVNRADVAHAMLRALHTSEWQGQCLSISS